MGQLNVLEYMREIGYKKRIYAQIPADLWYLQNTIDDFIEVFTQDKKSKKVYLLNKPNALFNHLDISKTISELGYAPKYSYIDWLKDFKEEEKNNRFGALWGPITVSE